MEDFERESLESLDCFDSGLRPFIPYLLQDLWEIGSSSKKILEMITRNKLHNNHLNILDIGCGKGAISIPISKKLGANIYGIDAVQEFIETANCKAEEFGVKNICKFVNGNAAELAVDLIGFNLVLMASVGQIFGNISQTLSKLEKCLSENGHIIIDDCYLPDNAVSGYTRCLRESEFYKQINESNFSLIDKMILSPYDTVENDKFIYKQIEIRAMELSLNHPGKKELFENYLVAQRKENYSLENDLQCATVLLKKK